tara:strand:+ start:826 stop:1266 length:441 start_codon:yes stop_codon:yes gene_type:complete
VGIEQCIERVALLIRKYSIISYLFGFLLPAIPAYADAEIICRVKSVGQRVFVLDSGIFSSNVLYKNKSGDLVDWCPETDSQKLAFGRGTAICKFSGIRLGNKLAWGETVIDFEKPSWKRRYRFAKLGSSWKQSQPGGRENATCVHR